MTTTSMMNKNYFSNKVRYDNACKNILSSKNILSIILKIVINEFKEEDPHFISKYCIEKNSNTEEFIEGNNTESHILDEGQCHFDIRFHATTRNNQKILFNIEAQNSTTTYPIIKRGIFYLSRMISGQYKVEFSNMHYENLKKCYSIWIVMNPKKDDRNTIKRYFFRQEQLDYDSDSDLLEAIIINLGTEKDGNYTGILKMLGTLFSVSMTIEEKKRILEKDFNLTLTIHEEREVTNMCTFSDAVEQMAIERGLKKGMLQGIQQGIQQGMQQGIQQGMQQGIQQGMQQGLQKGKFESICNLMSTFHLDIYQSMEALMIPKEDFEIYITLLREM